MSDALVTPIRAARYTYPAGHPEGPGPGEVFAFAIQVQSGTYLVDTGIGFGHAWIEANYKPTIFDLRASLGSHGIDPQSIRAIVCSHLHFDHCGNNALWPGLPIFVQRAELQAAHEKGYTVAEWLNFPGANYQALDGSVSLAPGLEIHFTPGHTAGHQSVAVVSSSGLELVVAQAAYSAQEFASYASLRTPPVREDAWSKEQYAESLHRLHALRPTKAYFSHDPRVWQRDA
jgi:glyoxylase-like metal-dependent hydrolase (beta-lactamase superfamily II)